MAAKLFTYVGAWGLVGFTVLLGLFAAGYAPDDPGGWRGVGMVAAYTVPTALLAGAAWRWPERATVAVVPVVLLVALAWLALPLLPHDVHEWLGQVGPLPAVATAAVATTLAVLGLHRPGLAGALLVGLPLAAFVGLVLDANALREGPGPAGLLSTSDGVILPPMVVAGLLLLVGHALARHAGRPVAGARHRPAHA